jgi:hypothetical protein
MDPAVTVPVLTGATMGRVAVPRITARAPEGSAEATRRWRGRVQALYKAALLAEGGSTTSANTPHIMGSTRKGKSTAAPIRVRAAWQWLSMMVVGSSVQGVRVCGRGGGGAY